MKNNFFSIITVCFNSAETIEYTIQSVINQTYRQFEYIIVDGKSTDGTVDIIKTYAEKYPDKIRYISEKDSGIYDAMNKGIQMARGDLIGIINSDDYYEANALETINEEYKGEQYAVYYGFLRFLKNEQEYRIIMNNHRFLGDYMLCHPSCFLTKAVYDTFGGFSTDYKSASDYDLMLRLQNHSEICFTPVYHILANMRCGGISESSIGEEETYIIKRKYGIIPEREYKKYVGKRKIKQILRPIQRFFNL